MGWVKKTKGDDSPNETLISEEKLDKLNNAFRAAPIVESSGVMSRIPTPKPGLQTPEDIRLADRLRVDIEGIWHDVAHYYFDFLRAVILGKERTAKVEMSDGSRYLKNIAGKLVETGLNKEEAFHKVLDDAQLIRAAVHSYMGLNSAMLNKLNQGQDNLLGK